MSEHPADFTRTAPPAGAVAPATVSGSTSPQGLPPSELDGDPAFARPTHPGDVGRLGRYRVVRRLGAGGMGAVFLGHDVTLDRAVALKVMLPKFAANPAARARFLREARTAAQIRNEHVVAILDVDEVGGNPFIVMEFLQGIPLDRYLAAHPGLSIPQVVRFGMEVARGLAAAHALGLIHRDIKPANLFLESPHGRVKILDFGLAKEIDPAAGDGVTVTGQVVGTPAYMSPEQARGVAVDHRSDLFSLGVVLYKLATGRAPFAGPNPMAIVLAIGMDEPRPVRDLNPAIPQPLAVLIHHLLAKNPASRLQSADEVHAALAAVEDAAIPEASAVEDEYAAPLVVPAPETSEIAWGWVDASDVPEAVPAAEPATVPARARRGRGGFPWLVACVALATLIGAGLLIAFLNKANQKPELRPADPDENEVKPPRAVPKTPKADADNKADRKAAEWAVSKGGAVQVAGAAGWLTTTEALPAEPFRVRSVFLPRSHHATDPDIDAFAELPDLERICSRVGGVSDAGVERLSRFPAAKNYTVVSLACPNLTDAGVAHFARFTSLRAVRLAFSRVTAKGLSELNRHCPNLTHLTLDGGELRDADLAALKEFKNLTSVGLSCGPFTGEGVKRLADLPAGVRELYLRDAGCDDVVLEEVAKLPRLTALGLLRTSVTDDAVVRAAKARGLKRLHLFEDDKIAEKSRIDRLQERLPGCWVAPYPGPAWDRAAVELAWGTGAVFRPLDPVWIASVAKMTADEQVKAVGEELVRRNPRFDPASLKATVEGGAVVGLNLAPQHVVDLTPLRALPKLTRLNCYGGDEGGAIADVSPLAGTPLRTLSLHRNRGVSDLSPLIDCPLAELDVVSCGWLYDLGPLAAMKVEVLKLQHSGATDLSPVAGTPLREIHLNPTQVKDLSPLAECGRLESIRLDGGLLKLGPAHKFDELRTLRNLTRVEDIPVGDFWPALDRRKDVAALPGPRATFDAHADYARWVAFDGKGERLASAGIDGKVRLWNPSTGDAVRTISPPDGQKTGGQAAEFVPGTDGLLAASYHDGLRFWDANTGTAVGGRLPPFNQFWCLAVSPDGKTVAVNPASGSQAIERYAVADRKQLPGLVGHTAGVAETAFSADSKSLASAGVGSDCSIRVWDLESGREVCKYPRPTWDANVSVAFGPDGLVMFATSYGSLGFLDPMAAQVARQLRWFPLGAAAYGPGGEHLILGGMDGVVTVMNARSGRVVAECNGGSSRVWRIAVSPDGKTVATAHHDGKVRLWDWAKMVGPMP